MCQNPPVISYKAPAIGQKEVFLRINVYQDAFSLFFEQLLKHFPSFTGRWYNIIYAPSAQQVYSFYRKAAAKTLITLRPKRCFGEKAGFI
jgi:hypothetical protein